MPVYNGEHYISMSIEKTLSVMKHYGITNEIIVVDDGSTDNTKKGASKIALRYSNVKVVGYTRNRGKGFAFLYGYRKSKGDIIVLLDSDLDIKPEQIPLLLKIMQKESADVVITNKWHPLSITKSSTLRRFLSRSYNLLVQLITGLQISDTQTGAKAFKRYVLDKITPQMYLKRYAFDVELLLLARKHGYKIAEAPSIKEINLTSAFKPREILYMLLELMSLVYRHGRV